jgi:hypothetical protein
MEKFIELTEVTNEIKLKINLKHIVYYNQYDEIQSRIFVAFKEGGLYVKETYQEISEAIEKINQ